ncbi:MAG: hypothetical protein SGILL_009230 [Bacillariaceae sp.]
MRLSQKQLQEIDDAASVAEVLQSIVESDDEDHHSFRSSASSSATRSTGSSSYPSSSDDDQVPEPTYQEFHSDDDNDAKETVFDEESYTDYSESAQEQDRIEHFLSCLDLIAAASNSNNSDDTVDEEDGESPKSHATDITKRNFLDDPDILKDIKRSLHSPGGLAKGLDPTRALYIKLFEFAQAQRDKEGRSTRWFILGTFKHLSDIRGDMMWAQDAAYRRENGEPYVAWADYYKKEQKDLVRPWFIYGIILGSIAHTIIAFDYNDWKFEPLDINPFFGVNSETLLYMGALQGRDMIETKQWWRLITPMTLHAGIVHLVINCCAMALVGRMVERNHGFWRASGLFIVSAIGGNMFSALLQPADVLMGASGGLFGHMGMCVADILLNWKLLFLVFENRMSEEDFDQAAIDDEIEKEEKEDDSERKWISCSANYNFWMRFFCGLLIIVDLLCNSLLGFTPFVDNFAHLGGLAYGFLLSCTVLRRMSLEFFGQDRKSSMLGWFCHKTRIVFLRTGIFGAVALFVVSCILLAFSDGKQSPCLSCRYITCIPTRWWACDICDSVSTLIYNQSHSPYYDYLQMDCPQGYIQRIDISFLELETVSEVDDELLNLCRAECSFQRMYNQTLDQ